MSFVSFKEIIEEGDTAILYLSASNLHAIKVLPQIKNKHGESVENVFQTTYGALKVASLIGTKYGSKIQLSRGWAYILYPTPELWTLTLPHRTQIIYTPDISVIILQLEIRPGSFVVESGTGSGSLTHALARTVQPNGTVRSFDFHETRFNIAKEEFEDHGISNVVLVSHRDVCNDGFGEDIDGMADAVFLDLPHPWLVIRHACKAIKPEGGRICSFSPCIEQVQKTCLELRASGFVELTTMECLQRELQVANRTMPVLDLESDGTKNGDNKQQHSFVGVTNPQSMPGHTGYLTFATLPPLWARPVASAFS